MSNAYRYLLARLNAREDNLRDGGNSNQVSNSSNVSDTWSSHSLKTFGGNDSVHSIVRNQMQSAAKQHVRPGTSQDANTWLESGRPDQRQMLTEDGVYTSVMYDLEPRTRKDDKERGLDDWFARNKHEVEDNVWGSVTDIGEKTAEHPFMKGSQSTSRASNSNRSGSDVVFDESTYRHNPWLRDPMEDLRDREVMLRHRARDYYVRMAGVRMSLCWYAEKNSDIADLGKVRRLIAESYDHEVEFLKRLGC